MMSSEKDVSAQAENFIVALLICAVALNAAGAMVVEIVAGRMLAPYFGMSLYTWTTVIGVVLAGLALGHWLGGWLATSGADSLRKRIGLAFWAGAAATALIMPVVGFVAGSLAQKAVALPVAITLSGFAAFFLPSLLAGLVQPLATTLALQLEGRVSGPVIGRMLAAGAFGSIVGTFLSGFVLVPYLGSSGTLWLVAALNAVLGALYLPGLNRAGTLAGAIALIAGAPLVAGFFQFPGFSVPCQVESRYFCIRIDPADHLTGRPSKLMALDHLVHSVNDAADPGHLFSPYVHLVDEIARVRFENRGFSAFFIGGGGYTLPRAWSTRGAAMTITVAEIDPVVTRLARSQMWFEPGRDVETVSLDARLALTRAAPDQRYDVIFGDAFHDISIPSHLVTDEFHALVAARLSPGGFYVVNVVDSPVQPRLLASIVITLKLRFPAIEVWVSPDDARGAGRATFIVYASDHGTGLPSTYRAQSGLPHVWLRVALPSIGADSLGVVLTDDFAPVDRLLAALWRAGE
jgi:predicted membrane-bound spermidine synthase